MAWRDARHSEEPRVGARGRLARYRVLHQYPRVEIPKIDAVLLAAVIGASISTSRPWYLRWYKQNDWTPER